MFNKLNKLVASSEFSLFSNFDEFYNSRTFNTTQWLKVFNYFLNSNKFHFCTLSGKKLHTQLLEELISYSHVPEVQEFLKTHHQKVISSLLAYPISNFQNNLAVLLALTHNQNITIPDDLITHLLDNALNFPWGITQSSEYNALEHLINYKCLSKDQERQLINTIMQKLKDLCAQDKQSLSSKKNAGTMMISILATLIDQLSQQQLDDIITYFKTLSAPQYLHSNFIETVLTALEKRNSGITISLVELFYGLFIKKYSSNLSFDNGYSIYPALIQLLPHLSKEQKKDLKHYMQIHLCQVQDRFLLKQDLSLMQALVNSLSDDTNLQQTFVNDFFTTLTNLKDTNATEIEEYLTSLQALVLKLKPETLTQAIKNAGQHLINSNTKPEDQSAGTWYHSGLSQANVLASKLTSEQQTTFAHEILAYLQQRHAVLSWSTIINSIDTLKKMGQTLPNELIKKLCLKMFNEADYCERTWYPREFFASIASIKDSNDNVELLSLFLDHLNLAQQQANTHLRKIVLWGILTLKLISESTQSLFTIASPSEDNSELYFYFINFLNQGLSGGSITLETLGTNDYQQMIFDFSIKDKNSLLRDTGGQIIRRLIATSNSATRKDLLATLDNTGKEVHSFVYKPGYFNAETEFLYTLNIISTTINTDSAATFLDIILPFLKNLTLSDHWVSSKDNQTREYLFYALVKFASKLDKSKAVKLIDSLLAKIGKPIDNTDVYYFTTDVKNNEHYTRYFLQLLQSLAPMMNEKQAKVFHSFLKTQTDLPYGWYDEISYAMTAIANKLDSTAAEEVINHMIEILPQSTIMHGGFGYNTITNAISSLFMGIDDSISLTDTLQKINEASKKYSKDDSCYPLYQNTHKLLELFDIVRKSYQDYKDYIATPASIEESTALLTTTP